MKWMSTLRHIAHQDHQVAIMAAWIDCAKHCWMLPAFSAVPVPLTRKWTAVPSSVGYDVDAFGWKPGKRWDECSVNQACHSWITKEHTRGTSWFALYTLHLSILSMRICNFYVCAISIIRNHSKNMLSFEDPVKKREQASNTFTRMISYYPNLSPLFSPHSTHHRGPCAQPCKSGHEAKALPIQGPHWPYCWGLSPAD